MNSWEALKRVAEDRSLPASSAAAVDRAEALLESDMEQVTTRLYATVKGAPAPVEDMVSYVLDAGGKRIRPALCLLTARLFSAQQPPVAIAAVCELLHNATLLHDDVIDDGDARRGKPAARKVWSNAFSVLAGDYVLMRCVDLMRREAPDQLAHFVETLRRLVEGEIVQLRLRETVTVDEDAYFEIIRGKTASLFAFATVGGSLWADAPPEGVAAMRRYGESVGEAFQLVDDVLDFSSDPEAVGKDLLADVSQGKMTLPLILASRRFPEVVSVLEGMVASGDTSEAARLVDMVHESGALEVVRSRAEDVSRQAVDQISGLADVDGDVQHVLGVLAASLVQRLQ